MNTFGLTEKQWDKGRDLVVNDGNLSIFELFTLGAMMGLLANKNNGSKAGPVIAEDATYVAACVMQTLYPEPPAV